MNAEKQNDRKGRNVIILILLIIGVPFLFLATRYVAFANWNKGSNETSMMESDADQKTDENFLLPEDAMQLPVQGDLEDEQVSNTNADNVFIATSNLTASTPTPELVEIFDDDNIPSGALAKGSEAPKAPEPPKVPDSPNVVEPPKTPEPPVINDDIKPTEPKAPEPPKKPKSPGHSSSSPDPSIAIVDSAMAAAEKASYADTTQDAHHDQNSLQGYVADIAKAAVDNDTVTVTTRVIDYKAPIEGDADNPNGVNGSLTFKISVRKGTYEKSTTEKTITIFATKFNGITNVQSITAAVTSLKDGTVHVSFRASEDERTNAVLSYVNSLLTGDAAGVSASITNISGTDKYEVVLKKGNASDKKIIHMTIIESADPDIAIVEAAKSAIENGNYAEIPQSVYKIENDVELYLFNHTKTLVDNNLVTTLINKTEYIKAIAGDADIPEGINGFYEFTITVSKGEQERTTILKRVVLISTKFTGLSNADAVASAKAMLPNGSVNVSFRAPQEEKTSAVQVYVNDLLTGDAAGVSAVVTYNTDTNKYDVALTKGSKVDLISLDMTIIEAPDPDIAIVEAAKLAADNAIYEDVNQDELNTESSAKAYAQTSVVKSVNNPDVAVQINTDSFSASIAGDADNPEGIQGNYSFTADLSKGEQERTTELHTIAIIPTPFTGLSNAQAVATAKAALVNGTVHVSFRASQDEKTSAVQSYVNSLLTGDASEVGATVAYNIGSDKYDVNLAKGSKVDHISLDMTIIEAPDPDIAIVVAAKIAAQNTAFQNLNHSSEFDVKTYVASLVSASVNNGSVAVSVNGLAYSAPISGDADNPDGVGGSYSFTITVSKGEQSRTTETKVIPITSVSFTGVTNAQAIAAAKAALVNGTVTAPYLASQDLRTVSVQNYANSLLVGDAAGVTAIVTYNSITGLYDISLQKGTKTGNTNLQISILEDVRLNHFTVQYADFTNSPNTGWFAWTNSIGQIIFDGPGGYKQYLEDEYKYRAIIVRSNERHPSATNLIVNFNHIRDNDLPNDVRGEFSIGYGYSESDFNPLYTTQTIGQQSVNITIPANAYLKFRQVKLGFYYRAYTVIERISSYN